MPLLVCLSHRFQTVGETRFDVLCLRASTCWFPRPGKLLAMAPATEMMLMFGLGGQQPKRHVFMTQKQYLYKGLERVLLIGFRMFRCF